MAQTPRATQQPHVRTHFAEAFRRRRLQPRGAGLHELLELLRREQRVVPSAFRLQFQRKQAAALSARAQIQRNVLKRLPVQRRSAQINASNAHLVDAHKTHGYEAVRCLPCGKPCCARDVVKPLRKRVLLLITRRGSHSTAAPSKGCARTQERERCRRLLGRRELGARRSTRRRSERDTSSGGAPAGWGVGAGPPPSHPEKLEHGPSLCHPSPARPENPSGVRCGRVPPAARCVPSEVSANAYQQVWTK